MLVEPLSDPVVQRALAAAIIAGVTVPVLGCYVVLRGMAFLGDALAHIILPGVALALLAGWPLLAGAIIAGVVAALLIGALERTTEIKEDTAIGVVFAAALALGVALLASQDEHAEELEHILFGDLASVTQGDLWLMAALGAAALVTVAAFSKEFLILSFDQPLARTLQLPVTRLNNLLLVLLAVVIVLSLQTVGVALVLALLVTPAAAAYLLTRRLPVMMVLSAVIGALSGVVGVFFSYYLVIPSGAAIVLVATTVFAVVYLLAPRRGVLLRQAE